MAAAKNRAVQRIELIGDLLEQRLLKSDTDVVFFSFDEMSHSSFTGSRFSFEETLKVIADESNGNISFRIRELPPMMLSQQQESVTASGGMKGSPILYPATPIGIEVFVKEPSRLNKDIKAARNAATTGRLTAPQDRPKKYLDAKEPIELKSLNVKIIDDRVEKGSGKFLLSDIDKCLVYFLYFKSKESRDERFSVDRLMSELSSDIGKKSEGHIKNRISIINTSIKRLVMGNTTGKKTSIPRLIESEARRGYYLNPKLLEAKITRR